MTTGGIDYGLIRQAVEGSGTTTAPVLQAPTPPSIPWNIQEAYTLLDSRKNIFPVENRGLTREEQLRLFPDIDRAPQDILQLAEFMETGQVAEPVVEPEAPRVPISLQFFKGAAGGVEDLAKTLGYTFLPDEWLGREKQKQVPLPDRKPFIAVQDETSYEEATRQMEAGRSISWVPAHMAEDARKKVEEDWARGYQLVDTDLMPWEFERNVPTTGWESIGRLFGGGLGLAEPPMTITELQNQPWWLQSLDAFAMPGLTGPAAIPQISTVLRGGVAGRQTVRIATPPSAALKKLQNSLKDAKAKLPQQKELYRAERSERFEEMARYVAEGTPSGELPTITTSREAWKKMGGELPKVEFDRLADAFTAAEVREFEELLFTRSKPAHSASKHAITIGENSIDVVDWQNNVEAFARLFNTDILPQPSQIKRLEKIFGTSFVDDVMGTRSLGNKAWATFLDAWNLPKALIASIDISAPGRQGWKMLGGKFSGQFAGAFLAQLKLLDPFLGRERFDVMMASIQSHKHYDKVKNGMKVFEGELGTGRRGTNAAEDAYMSKWISRIPGFEISERAYVGFLNKLRFDSAYKQLDDWERMGFEPSLADLEDLGRLINYSTGRGSIGGGKLAEILNAAHFSPRFAVSQPQFYSFPVQTALRMTGRAGPEARNAAVSKIWAQITVGHVVKNLGILAGLKFGFEAFDKDVEIEIDPRATDFGKVRVGSTRWDFWGGDAQWAKFIARMLPGVGGRKLSTTGEIIDADRADEIGKMWRSKLNPMAANAWEIGITQEDFYGNAITTDPENVKEQAINRLLFMGAQDVRDAMALHDNDADAFMYAVPGFLGVGVQSYETAMDVKDEIAVRTFDAMYEDLDVETQLDIDADPAVLAFHDERNRKRKPENPDAVWFRGVSDYRVRIQEIEQGSEREPGLLQFIESGASGKALDKAIRSYLTKKSEAWRSNIPVDVAEVKNARYSEKTDMFRQKYWSVTIPRDLKTGIPDYEHQEIQRQIILEDAVAAGVSEADIKAQGPVSNNEVISEVVQQWLDDHDYLRENFYNVADQIIKDAGYWDYYQRFKASQYSSWYREADPTFAKLLRDINTFKQQLRLIDPEIERILFRWGDISNVTHPEIQGEMIQQADPNELIEAMGTIGQGQ